MCKITFKILFVLLLNWGFPSPLHAQNNNFINYSVAEGLAQSQVYCMLEGQQGYLWMGTQGGGLSRFDGLNFTNFSKKNGLPNNFIEALFEDSTGLWIGTQNGMAVYDGLQFKAYFPEPGKQLFVTAFYRLEDGGMLTGTDKGLYVFNGAGFSKYEDFKPLQTAYITTIFKDSKANLWIGSKSGLIRSGPNGRNFYTERNGLNDDEITDITEDQLGQVWISSFGGVHIWNEAAFGLIEQTENGLPSNFIRSLYADKDGQVWIGTQNAGIAIWSPVDSVFNVIDDNLGLSKPDIRDILQDRWGNIWIATSGAGVDKYFGQQFSHFYLSDNRADNYVYGVTQDTSGKMWFSAADNGVCRMDSAGFTFFGAAKGFVNNKSKALYCDSKGRLWFGSNNKGVAWYDGQQFQFLRHNNYWVANFTKDFEEDPEGNIWAASGSIGIYKIIPSDSTLFGLEKVLLDTIILPDTIIIQTDTIAYDSTITRFAIEQYSTQNILPSNVINALYLDQQNRMWWASEDQGIGYFTENGNLVHYDKDDGLPANEIRCITGDLLGNIWIGTKDQGIAKITGSGDSILVKTFNEADGLSSSTIYLMTFDNSNNLMVGCGNGIDLFSLDEEQNLKGVQHLGVSEGFYGEETCQNAVFEDQDGHFWFGSVNGVAKFITGTNQVNTIPPQLHFTNISLFYEPFQETAYKDWLTPDKTFKKGLKLPYHQNHLGFDFLGINFSNPEKVQYQWQLVGQEAAWSPLSYQHSQNYSNLAPGDYTFRVRAFNEDMVMTETPIQVEFSILPPFWQRWWFIAGSALLGIALITWFFKSRIERERKKAREDQEKLEIKNNLLQLEQKALQLQMNPHFIFNALNTIQSLFLNDEKDAARILTSKFAKLMRAILQHSRETSIPLQQELELLDNYLSIEQYSRQVKFTYAITTDKGLDPDEVNIPPMMIQPFVENAVKHGVAHLKEGGKIEVHFSGKGALLECSIRDNGIGRAASAKINAQNTRKHQSVALAVTKERLRLLQSDNGKTKSLEIIDLKSETGEAEGTLVLLSMPLEAW